MIKRTHEDECFFWSTHSGAELDLLIVRGKKRLGFEIKRTQSPSITPSMRSALVDLKLNSLDVIHSGKTTFPLLDRVKAISVHRITNDIEPL